MLIEVSRLEAEDRQGTPVGTWLGPRVSGTSTYFIHRGGYVQSSSFRYRFLNSFDQDMNSNKICRINGNKSWKSYDSSEEELFYFDGNVM